MIQPWEAMVAVPGGSVYAVSWQPEVVRGDPILLLHDSIGCVGLWRDFPAALAERNGRRVVAYDRLGFGRSSPRFELPSDDFIAEEVDSLVLLMDFLEIGKAVLFGYSVGGSMALTAAATVPDRVSAVISESTQAFVEPRTLKGIEDARRSFADPQQLEKLRRWHGDKTEWVLSAWMDVWTSPPFRDWSLADILPRVTCPVLAIHGDRDEYGSVAFPKTICRLAGGDCEMALLENCGHVPHREREPEVHGLVCRFLQHIVG